MDEKILSGILVRIERIKSELDELEKEAKSLSAGLASQEKADETAMSVSEEPIDLSISVPDISEQIHEAVSEAEPSEDIPVADEEPVEVETAEENTAVDEAGEAKTAEEKTAEEKTTEGEIAEESEIEDMPEILEDGPEAEASEPEIAEPIASEPEKAETKPEQKAPVAEKKTRKRKSVMDTELAEKAVLDVMAEKEAWRTDRPGYPVKNIISAISLNDRLLLINSLFREDPVLFQDTIAKFNGMASLQEAIDYIKENFKDWDLNSEPVYRLMMAVRRKLQ